jgi:hypothetical protein
MIVLPAAQIRPIYIPLRSARHNTGMIFSLLRRPLTEEVHAEMS